MKERYVNMNIAIKFFKPKIKQALTEFDSVMYIDTSIRFLSSEISSIFEKKLQDVGIVSRFIQSSLPCYTDERMFEWFGESKTTYEFYKSAEANFIIIKNNFITSLIMKAWVNIKKLNNNCLCL
jgi:hypothetical protein